ncbi:histamine H2 receptor-like [Polyodon spathula]|uniref:histamine H2 receptor-like n=1 Tax=Polyodon spathula TaxID=7913 RepID=UPI001B7E441A|nr:histamine H2 receptor-like [Polyodon spathula]
MEKCLNSTMAATDLCLKRSMLSTVMLSFILGAVIVLTICGNVVVCLAVGINRKLRSLTNCFIVSLATTDLLLGLLVLPFSAVNELHRSWPFGATFCNIYTSLDVMLCTASILNLFMISLDRYYAVTAPLRYSMLVTPCRVAVAMGFIWVVSLMVSFLPIHMGWNTPDLTVQNKGEEDKENKCRLELNKGYVLVDAVGTFYLPLVVMCSTYYRIFKIAREQAKRINCCTASSSLNNHCSLPAKEHKATVTLATVMGAFIICWFPYFTVFTYQGLSEEEVDEMTFAIVLWLGYANSALNPILYAALNRDFRTAYSSLLHCHKVGPATAPPHSHQGRAKLLRGNHQQHSPNCKGSLPEERALNMQDRNGKENPFIRETTERNLPVSCGKSMGILSFCQGVWLAKVVPVQNRWIFEENTAEPTESQKMFET